MEKTNIHLIAVQEYYGDKAAERTQVPYINHIYEGLAILDQIGASLNAKEAYCLHPIYQVEKKPLEHEIVKKYGDKFDPHSVELALEYRKRANAYLCKRHYQSADDVVTLSDMPEVNDMLIADKVQNRKDFEVHYESQSDKETFDRSDRLSQYFKNWLAALGVPEEQYQQYKQLLIDKETITSN